MSKKVDIEYIKNKLGVKNDTRTGFIVEDAVDNRRGGLEKKKWKRRQIYIWRHSYNKSSIAWIYFIVEKDNTISLVNCRYGTQAGRFDMMTRLMEANMIIEQEGLIVK
jgi:hypothetical protein